jgi:chaperonin GroEL
VENSATFETTLEVTDGMNFDRGYISHYMVTDVERMEVVLDDPLILMTDLKILTAEDVTQIRQLLNRGSQPLLIIAEEVAPAAVMALLAQREGGGPVEGHRWSIEDSLPAYVIAWSLWRRAHQAVAQQAHFKSKV